MKRHSGKNIAAAAALVTMLILSSCQGTAGSGSAAGTSGAAAETSGAAAETSGAAASAHLSALKKAGLIYDEKGKSFVYYHLSPEAAELV